MGLYEADAPVIPEYIAHRLEAVKSDMKPTPGGRGRKSIGGDLWRFLRPKLFTMTSMQETWGSLHEIYPRVDGKIFAHDHGSLPLTIIDPDGRLSAIWDSLSLLLLLYVTFATPYRVCFAVEIPPRTLTWWFDLFLDAFFIVDILFNFRLAFWNDRGHREARSKYIARRYIRGWFLFDFIAAFPLHHIVGVDGESCAEGGATGSQSRIMKVARLVRMSRMLRVSKMKRY
jgi:hypothetical protein